MLEEEAVERAREDEREGKSPSTQAGEFVREEMEHIREGEHGARSPEQAIAIGLSKARRAGVKLPPPKRGKTRTKRQAKRDLGKGRASKRRKPSTKRSRATKRALKRESRRSASKRALSKHAKRVSKQRSARSRSRARALSSSHDHSSRPRNTISSKKEGRSTIKRINPKPPFR
jgi:hypothetical protein